LIRLRCTELELFNKFAQQMFHVSKSRKICLLICDYRLYNTCVITQQ
jgi:hypothetical protein